MYYEYSNWKNGTLSGSPQNEQTMASFEMVVSYLNEYVVQLSILLQERMNFEMEYLSSTLTVFDPQIRSRFYESSIKLVFATKEFVLALITFLFYISLIFIKLFTLALPYVSFVPNMILF